MQERSQIRSRKRTPPLVASICLAFICAPPCGAEINEKLVDPYLQREFQWAMFIKIKDLKPYLNYPGSKLNPLTRYCVTVNSFQQGRTVAPDSTPAQPYEEFWYHDEIPIGLRRYRNLNIKPNQIGAIFLGSTGNNAVAATNVLIRLALDLDLQDRAPSVVEVPLDKYDAIASELGNYSFFPKMPVTKGRQFSIHLRSYPYNKNKDEYYYLQH